VRGSVICDAEDELVGLIKALDADKGVEIVRGPASMMRRRAKPRV